MKKRIVITGMGGLGSTGMNLDECWQAIKKGESGVRQISQWDVDGWEYRNAAELKDYDPKTMISDRKLLKLISRQDVIGLCAAKQAVDQSGVLNYRNALSDATEFNDRTGVYIASPGVKFNQQYDLMPVFAKAQNDLTKFGDVLFDLVHPMWLLRILSNNVLAYVGIENNFKGMNQNIPNHGISGTQAILEAMQAIQANQMDRAIVVGYESAVEPQAQTYYASIGTLAKESLRPFSDNREGTILAEAGAAMFIESLESAEARGATIYAEILSGAIVNEAMGIFPISEDAEGLQRAISQALIKSELAASEVGMITAHANGTQHSDASEAIAINKLFGENTPVTGFKWSLGHSIAAAGVLETALTVNALNEGIVPGIPSLTKLAEDCQGINARQQHQALTQTTALCITRGFSSQHGCLLLRKM